MWNELHTIFQLCGIHLSQHQLHYSTGSISREYPFIVLRKASGGTIIQNIGHLLQQYLNHPRRVQFKCSQIMIIRRFFNFYTDVKSTCRNTMFFKSSIWSLWIMFKGVTIKPSTISLFSYKALLSYIAW